MGKEREKRGFIVGRERDMNGGSLVVGQEGSKFIALLEIERGGLLAGRQKEELIIVREREMEKEKKWREELQEEGQKEDGSLREGGLTLN